MNLPDAPGGSSSAGWNDNKRLVSYEKFLRTSSSSPLSLEEYATAIRGLSIEMCGAAATAHLGSVLSCADILSVVFQNGQRKTSDAADSPDFILSKGHAALGLYSALLLNSVISLSEFLSYAKKGSALEEHPSHHIPSVPISTGSLGHGLGFMAGRLQGKKIQQNPSSGIVLMSDGECNEGTVWEAALYAAAKKLGGLVAIVDSNGFQATGRTAETYGRARLSEMFSSFGWQGREVDGHNLDEMTQAVNLGLSSDTPYFVIAHTVKGKGVSFMEDDNNWHYRAPSESDVTAALVELGYL